MNHVPSILLACALAIPALAQDAKTDAAPAPEKSAGADIASSGLAFAASNAVVSAPLVMTDDYLHLAAEQAEIAGGGKAVFNFSITNAGDYVIEALVNAPEEDANSFFLNVDAMPEDIGIWDIDVTTGFEKRVVSWRGSGTDSSDEFAPKRFKLTPGAHKLIVVGREPGAQLKSLSIRAETAAGK